MDVTGSMALGREDHLPAAMPILDSPPQFRTGSGASVQCVAVRTLNKEEERRVAVDTPMNEACSAWERSLRPGQYFSEKGGNRPMRHRTQAVQGHPGARAWPRGPDGGAWGPQHLSPIPSERSYAPLVPSPTASPGRCSRNKGNEGFSSALDVAAVADAIAVEAGIEGTDRDALKPFEPIPLEEETLPKPPPAAPLEAPWRPPPPGFDVRTLRRQASTLRADGAQAVKDHEGVRRASERLAEILSATVENGRDNSTAARERLRRLHGAFRRLKGERLAHGEAVRAAVAWQESAEEIRDKLTSSVDRLRRAERAKADAQRTLDATVESNRSAEAEIVRLERALEEARHKDAVAAEMDRETRQEELADAFLRRDRSKPTVKITHGSSANQRRRSSNLFSCESVLPSFSGGDGADGDYEANSSYLDPFDGNAVFQRSAAAREKSAIRNSPSCVRNSTSPLLKPTLEWGFQILVEACRRSRRMRAFAEARRVRVSTSNETILREALAGWAVAAALAKQERSARRRRTEECAKLCLARWRLFAALEKRFRAEQKRRIYLRVMEALRRGTEEGRRRRELSRRLAVFILRRSFRAWRILRACATLTPREYAERRRAADSHRLLYLFETWHMSSLASAAVSRALVQGCRRKRDSTTLAATFRAWAALSRARLWHRRRSMRWGFTALSETASIRRSRRLGLTPVSQIDDDFVYSGTQAESSLFSPSRMTTVGSEWTIATEESARLLSGRCSGRRSYEGHGARFGTDWIVDSPCSWTAEGGKEPHGAFSAAHAIEQSTMDHQRQVMLRSGIRAFGEPTGNSGYGQDYRRDRLECARVMLVVWRQAAGARARAREVNRMADAAFRELRLRGAVDKWRERASANALQRRQRRKRMLRTAFVLLRQACANSRAQRTAGRALRSILGRRYKVVLRQAMRRLQTETSNVPGDTAAAAAMLALRGRAAKRRREREALGAAWRWWVGGWMRRRAEKLRAEELHVQRDKQRARELAEQLLELREASAALSQEASAVEKELHNAQLLVHEQEEALAASTKSLTEATNATADLKARLGDHPVNVKRKVTGRNRPGAHGGLAGSTCLAREQGRGKYGKKGSNASTVADDEGRRLRARRVAQQRGAAKVLEAAERKRREAQEKAAIREAAAARARENLAKQEAANRAAIEDARAVAQRYRDFLSQEELRVEQAEREKRRVRGETARLLARADGLERRTEEEATEGAREASAAESERAVLSLEVSTAEARARELMVILDERQQEAEELRRALAAKDCTRQQEQAFGAAAKKRVQHAVRKTNRSRHRKPPVNVRQNRRAGEGSDVELHLHAEEALEKPGGTARASSEVSGVPLENGGVESRHRGVSTATEIYHDLSESISVLRDRVSSGILSVSIASSASPPASALRQAFVNDSRS